MDPQLRLNLLKVVLIADGTVLAMLGLLLIFASSQMFVVFKLPAMPPAVLYMTGMWGALLVTVGLGYFLAARSPQSSAAWVLVGICRAVIELFVSTYYVLKETVSAQTAWLGVALAAWFALAYLILYPSRARLGKALQPRETASE